VASKEWPKKSGLKRALCGCQFSPCQQFYLSRPLLVNCFEKLAVSDFFIVSVMTTVKDERHLKNSCPQKQKKRS
jgi:hypothetical protein